MVKIEERSVYDHIANFLREKFNAKVLTEGGVGNGYVDVIFSFDSLPFVMEVKLGRKEKKLAEAVAQGYKYAQSINTRNVIALVLTQLSPGQEILIEKLDKLQSIILGSKVEGYVHTEYLEKWVENITLQQVLEEIYERTIKKEREVDFNSVVKAIREIVEDLYDIIRQARTDEIFEEVAKKLELFVGIGEIKDREKAKSQVNMLASYLLFNQILFYHIYKIKTNNPQLKPLSPITSLKDLQKYFDDLKRIDYRPIYSIELIDKIPEKLEIIEKINMVIKNVLVIRAEHITKDLAGRFFHALLPKEVAKVWAAFYTHPVAAEILANLAIDRWDEKVIDPACGSGTLLAASYQRKLDLYKEEVGRELTEEEIRQLHKKFLEEDITGIDIMPFAAHLTAINLSAQHLEATTNFLRIACMDSLELAPQLKSKDFVEKGILIKSFSKELQKTLTGLRKLVSREGALSLAEEKSEFKLTPVDVVIMNPPFSDREKLPKDYLEKLSDNSEFGRILGNICGHQINLWGYFLALADIMLKPNGKIAAVIPINIARGKATEKIRNHLLENYHIRYIIKTTKDLAFSESAAFRDILLVVEKRRPKENDETCIIFLNKSIREIKENEIKEIIKLKSGIEIRTIEYSELIRYKDNLMPLLYSFSLKNAKIINNFLEICFNRRPTLFKKLEETEIRFPHSFRPTGASEVLTITKKTDESRIKRALLLSIGEGENFIEVEIKHTNIKFKIPTKKLQYLLRTITGVGKLELTKEMMDYLIIEKYDEFDRIVKLSKEPNLKWNRKLEETINGNLKTLTTCCIPDKINLVSPNTKLIAFHSNKKFVVGSTICAFLTKNIESSKLMTLFFNSVISLAQILQYKSETQGAYTRMTIEDWLQFKILDVSKLEKERKILLELFEKLKDVEFPSILEQFEKRFWARVELDKTILKILGFSDEEIDYWLPRVYDAIVEELKAMKEVK
jgi:predicted RNA methylase/frataxin-like iron-binding protein CyaY